MDGLIEGRIVHYVMPDGRYKGEHRPAIIVKIWGDRKQDPTPCVQLAVFVDGTNDYVNLPIQDGSFMPCVWKTSVVYNEEKEPYTWHFPERD